MIKNDITFNNYQKKYLQKKIIHIKGVKLKILDQICDEILFKLYNAKLKPEEIRKPDRKWVLNYYFGENNKILCPCCSRQYLVRENPHFSQEKLQLGHVRPRVQGFEASKYNIIPICIVCNSAMKQKNIEDMVLYCLMMNEKINNGEELKPYYGLGLKNLDKVPKYSKYCTEDLRNLNYIEKVSDLYCKQSPNKRIRITR